MTKKQQEQQEQKEKDEKKEQEEKDQKQLEKERLEEAENRELEKPEEEESKSSEQEKDEEKESEEEDEKKDIDSIIEEKLKPFKEQERNKEKVQRRVARQEFLRNHPEYYDANRWDELLDELDRSINPDLDEGLYEQLEKAHVLLSYQDKREKDIANIQRREAIVAGGGDDSYQGGMSRVPEPEQRLSKEEDAVFQKLGVGKDALKLYNQKIEDGEIYSHAQ